jgi:hypothetical protein
MLGGSKGKHFAVTRQSFTVIPQKQSLVLLISTSYTLMYLLYHHHSKQQTHALFSLFLCSLCFLSIYIYISISFSLKIYHPSLYLLLQITGGTIVIIIVSP